MGHMCIGDNVQLGIVLKHLKHYHPDWFIGVEAKRGAQSCFYGLADAVHLIERPFTWHGDYEKMMHLPWPRPERSYDLGTPSTKALRCLLDFFPECKPIEEFFYYDIHPDNEAQERVNDYIEKELHGEPFGVVHYRGTSSPADKDLEEMAAAALLDAVIDRGLRAVLLDFHPRCPFAEVDCEGLHLLGKEHTLWPYHIKGLADAGVMAELIRRAEIFFGIDSGPAFLANAVGTESHIFWTNHHPIYCHDLDRGNVTHHVYWATCKLHLKPGNQKEVAQYFFDNYEYTVYESHHTSYIEQEYQTFSGGVPIVPLT